MIDKIALNNFVLAQIPENIITYLIRNIILIYNDSWEYAFGNYEREQAIDLLYHIRRGKIETFLRLLSNQFPEIKIDCKINDSLTNHHVEVMINDLIITESFTQFKDQKVREAKFRNTLSEFNIQFELYPKFPEEEKTNKYYVILNHGASGREPKRPEFFQLLFPSTYSNNVADPIDILNLFKIPYRVLEANIEYIKTNNNLSNPPLKRPGKTEENES